MAVLVFFVKLFLTLKFSGKKSANYLKWPTLGQFRVDHLRYNPSNKDSKKRFILYLLSDFGVTEGQLERSNQIGTGLTLYKEWQLSVDLKLDQNQINAWSNILALQAQCSMHSFDF